MMVVCLSSIGDRATREEMVTRMPQYQQQYETGGIVGIATVVDVVTHSESPWFFGRYGWVLKEAHAMPFVP
jgi:ribosomal protein L21E